MKIRRAIAVLPMAVVVASFGAMGACGSRTALVDGIEEEETPDANVGDTQRFDSGFDVQIPNDATPPVEASVCPKGAITAFILSDNAELFTFDPPTLQTTSLGTIACPTTDTPWSLTASSAGLLYVIYQPGWNIYQVDPQTLNCTATPYVPFQNGLGDSTGITVLSDQGVESLYVFGEDSTGNDVLDVGNLTDFTLTTVGTVLPTPSESQLDLRANAFGRIFGLGPSGSFVEIDRKTAARLSEDQTGFSNSGGSWALLTWNDMFYFFNSTAVSQYDITTKTLTNVGSVGISVVGASAAPCIH